MENLREASSSEACGQELLASPTLEHLREEVASPTPSGTWEDEEEKREEWWPIFYPTFRVPPPPPPPPPPPVVVTLKCCHYYDCDHDFHEHATLPLCPCPCPAPHADPARHTTADPELCYYSPQDEY